MGKRPRQTRLRQWNVIFLLDQTPPTNVLLLKRAPEKSFAPNRYTGIGGKVESDETIEQSAYRELKEETGLTTVTLYRFADLVRPPDDILYYFYGFYANPVPPECNEGTLEWVPVKQVLKKDFIPTTFLIMKEWKRKKFALPSWTMEVKQIGERDGMKLVKVVGITDGLYTNDMDEVKKGIYLHYKGTKATVLGVARHSETMEEFVIYKHKAKENSKMEVWIRPKKMFLEQVEVNGKLLPRFKFIQQRKLAK